VSNEEYVVGYRDPHIGRIVRIDDVTPPAPPKQLDYIFEHIGYEARVMLGKHMLESLCSWTEGGKDNAHQAAQSFCNDHRINRNSELEVIVVEKKSYYRMRPTSKRNYGPKFDALDFGCRRDVPEDTETVVWSSKKDR
jgi:hypothetical protein